MYVFILFTIIYYFMNSNFSSLGSSSFGALEEVFLKRVQIYLLHHYTTA